ncbi:unnamed protein product [Clonostachys rosea]|uniref:Heterokaryon incompatibility domain-containing protein n=1 Tax=Bionectria ochroleuca TaxID=29856 RepID=A0ABY6V4K5_BIOOC|nr:unnamed protein product [Clonostachys rosea]
MASEKMSRYQYQPLDSNTNQIRLLRLRKGYHTDTIECEIFDTSLDEADCMPYEALSYTWGYESEPAEIRLNGELAWVTWNLYMALSCLRLSDQDRLLWVDALCINQANDQERGHQVSHMKEIYQNAEQVLIWLGRAGDNVDLLFDLMTQLERRAMLQSNYRKQSPNSWRAIWPAMVEEQGGTQSVVYVKRRIAMLDLLQREWFRRIWVLQEAASARRALIVCGWRSISSRTFALMPSLMDIEPDAHSRAVLEIMPGHLRGSCWWSEKRTLETLLWKFRSSQASDPRDRVYALLGISSDACRKEVFPANYEIDVGLMSQNAISYLLFKTVHDPFLHHLPRWDLDRILSLLETPDLLAIEVFKWALFNSDDPLALRILSLEGLDVNQDGSPGRTPLLILISQGGHEKVLYQLLSRDDIDVNVKVAGFTALYQAVMFGHKGVVKALLTREDIHIQAICPDGFSPLTAAADKGDFEMVRVLLDHGAHIDGSYNGSSITPLRVASTSLHPKAVKLFLERSAKADGPNGYSLLTASDEVNVVMAKSLLDGGENVEGVPNESCTTPLLVAVRRHYPEVVRLLLERGAEVNTKHGEFGSSPLWAASELGYVEIMTMLLDAGADIESHQLPHRATPLACAVENRHWHAVDLLLDRGANPFALHTDGEMVIHKAARFGKIEFLRILHQRNIPMDTEGSTPLHVAAKHGQVEELKFLLSVGADVSRKNEFNQTPLMEAAAFSDSSIVEILIEHGSDVNTLEDGGRTPLMVASLLCRLDTVRVLLNHGADPNIQDVSGKTALMRIVSAVGVAKKHGLSKDAEIAMLLLQSGADVNRADHQGRTALSWAAERGLLGLIRVLLMHGADKTMKDMFGREPLSYALGKTHSHLQQ